MSTTNQPWPTDQEGWMRRVEKEIRRLTRRVGGVANATVTTDGEQVRVSSPTPRYVPTGPPASAPTITVAGSDTGMTVVAEGVVDPTTILDYYLDGVLVTSTRSVVVFWQTDATGQPMADGVVYSWQVFARNDLGSVGSNTAQGSLNSAVSSRTVLGWVAAGFLLAGQIQVGNITIDPDSGITIPLANGGTIAFPANGDDAVITAVLRARSLVVEDNLRVLGQTNVIEGGLSLASGIVAPTVPLRAFPTWTDPSLHLATDVDPGANVLGGIYDNGTQWVVPYCAYGTSLGFVDKTTGHVNFLPAFGAIQANFAALGGITKIGSSWYLLGQDYDRGGDWYVYVYNSSWVKTGEWLFSTYAATTGRPSITTDGTSLWIAYYSTAGGALRIFSRTTSGAPNFSYVLSTTWVGDVRGVYVGSADFGAPKIVVAAAAANRFYAWSNTSPADGATLPRDTTHDWLGGAGEALAGLTWDGTRFHSVSPVGNIWHYSRVAAPVTRSLASSWYDSDGTTHETPLGTALSYTIGARTWTMVDSDPPNDGGGIDDPDSVRIYADNHRQPDLGPGVTSKLYDTFDLTGAAGQTVNGFASVAGALGTLAATNGGFIVDGESGGDWPGKLTVSGIVTSGAGTTTTSSGFVDIPVAPGFNPTQYECFVDNSATQPAVDMSHSSATVIRCFFRNITAAGSPALVSTNVGEIRWVAYP